MIRDQNNMLFITARNSDSNKTFPLTRQNTLALLIGMKLSSPDSIYPKVDLIYCMLYLGMWYPSILFLSKDFASTSAFKSIPEPPP